MATFPERAAAAVNAALVAVFDLALGPLLRLPPLAALAVIAVLTAIVVVLVVRRVTDQARLRATRRRMQAALFEIRLDADDPAAVVRSFGDVLFQNAIYLRLNLVSLLLLIVPLSLMIAQLQAFYGYSGLQRGEPALITVESSEASSLTLDAPGAIRIETEPVQLSGGTTVWRIVPAEAGVFEATIHTGGTAVTKMIVVGDAPARRSPIRTHPDLEQQLLYPSEPPLPADAAMRSISIGYPEGRIDLFGWRTHWLIVYFLFSLVAALLLSRRFGVTI